MKFDAAIFDIDGTLWNACQASAEGWENAFNSLSLGLKVTGKDIESVAGKPFDGCVETLFPGLIAKYKNILDTISKYEKMVVANRGGNFYDDVLNGIPQLAKQQPVYLVSNCQDWYMETFLDKSGLRNIVSGYDCNGMSGEPKNVMLQNIKNNYSLHNPVYVGDTSGDESSANKAGIHFLYVSYGFGEPTGNPDSVDTFTQALDYIKG